MGCVVLLGGISQNFFQKQPCRRKLKSGKTMQNVSFIYVIRRLTLLIRTWGASPLFVFSAFCES